MNATPTLPAEPAPTTAPLQGAVALVRSFAHVSATLAQVDVWRRDASLLRERNLPASFLKHADEQGVCAFAAVMSAIRSSGRTVDAFSDWSVVAAPRFPGRTLGGASIVRFFDEGIRGISPHIIPQNSTHSISGLISVGLGMGGPNLGAGGGVHSLREGLATAFTKLSEGSVPGLWFIATGWDPEPTPLKNGRAIADGHCHAAALALELGSRSSDGLRLELRAVRRHRNRPTAEDTATHPASLVSLCEALDRYSASSNDGAPWKLDLGWGAEVAFAARSSPSACA